MKQNHIWVVEMFINGTQKWMPTVNDIALTREGGKYQQNMWQSANPDDCFRLRKYVSETK